MKIEAKPWLLVMGIASLLMSAGCHAEQSAKVTAKKEPIVIPIVAGELESESPVEEKETKTKPTSDTFVFNENLKPVYFEISQSDPNTEAREALEKNSAWLLANPPMLVQVAGYTDVRGSVKRNFTLAERRARKVRDFYVSKGISKDRIAVVVMGQEGPTCLDITEECLTKSRRAETLVENKSLAIR